MLPGYVCRLTCRCHNRDFLLKFAVDRKQYRKRLRDCLRVSSVSLLNYCITASSCWTGNACCV